MYSLITHTTSLLKNKNFTVSQYTYEVFLRAFNTMSGFWYTVIYM